MSIFKKIRTLVIIMGLILSINVIAHASSNVNSDTITVNKKVLFIEPIDSKFLPLKIRTTGATLDTESIFPSSKFQVDYRRECGIDVFKDMNKYGIIIINAHGMPDSKQGTSIWTGSYEWDMTDEEKKYRDEGLISVSPSEKKVCITPKFIATYNKNLPNSIVFLGVCDSLNDRILANAFEHAGASSVFGFSGLFLSLGINGELKDLVNQLESEKSIYDAAEYTRKKAGWGNNFQFNVLLPENKDKKVNFTDDSNVETKPVPISSYSFPISYPAPNDIPAGTPIVTTIPNAVILGKGESIEFTNNTSDIMEVESTNDNYSVDFATYRSDNTFADARINATQQTCLLIYPNDRAVITNRGNISMEIHCIRRIFVNGTFISTTDGFKPHKVNKQALGIVKIEPGKSYSYTNSKSVKTTIKFTNTCDRTCYKSDSTIKYSNSIGDDSLDLETNEKVVIKNNNSSDIYVYGASEFFNP